MIHRVVFFYGKCKQIDGVAGENFNIWNLNQFLRQASEKQETLSDVIRSLNFYLQKIYLCMRRDCAPRDARVKVFLSKKHLLLVIFNILYTNERKECLYDTNYKRKNGCQYQLTNLLYRVNSGLSAPFLKIF